MTAKIVKTVAVAGALAVAGIVGGCGEAHVTSGSENTAQVDQGAQLFHDRCSGCHSLNAAAAEGSATNVHQREHTDGPNFNQRKETVPQVLYAIRNGGFSGAIMPENIVVGQDAQAVAAFVSKYSGGSADNTAQQGISPSDG